MQHVWVGRPERSGGARVTLRGRAQVYALSKERDALRRGADKLSSTSELLKEKDDIIKQVFQSLLQGQAEGGRGGGGGGGWSLWCSCNRFRLVLQQKNYREFRVLGWQ